MKFSHVPILGRWIRGFALDAHTLRSEFIGDDEYGRPQFKTTRTEVGEALYQLKYRADHHQVKPLAQAAVRLIRHWKPPIDALIAVPPSNSRRRVQPVRLVGREISRILGKELREDAALRQSAARQIKDVTDPAERQRLLEGAFRIKADAVAGRSILLFDDLYRSGATMNALAGAIYESGADKVFALALTRTSRTQ